MVTARKYLFTYKTLTSWLCLKLRISQRILLFSKKEASMDWTNPRKSKSTTLGSIKVLFRRQIKTGISITHANPTETNTRKSSLPWVITKKWMNLTSWSTVEPSHAGDGEKWAASIQILLKKYRNFSKRKIMEWEVMVGLAAYPMPVDRHLWPNSPMLMKGWL